eukprot:CAMPEP_0197041764 /NCGR_PEP_ID=MMETSP1384-20130603/18258_1 /TAXON_ID=29189 /ORGANISM="Ammonia sp." /LENGTH=487 /DNA_ID=CAMNT_0042472745 /DNA_START=16 /DNA_END=1475 /DNA_ORIENTATION=+
MAAVTDENNIAYPDLPPRPVANNENAQLLHKQSSREQGADKSAKEVPEGTSSLFVTILNMIKLMIGSGMLAIPWAMAHVGLYPGIIAALFCATFDFIAAMFLIYASEVTQIYEYSALLRLIGPVWEYSGAIVLLYVVSGSLVGYLILIGDFVNDALQQMGVQADAIPAQRQVIIIIFTVAVLTPLVLLKNLSALRFSSFVGIAAIAYCLLLLVFTTFVHVGKDEDFTLGSAYDPTSVFELGSWNIGFFVMTNVCTQAYVCHYSVQRVYLDLQQRTVKRMWIANGVSYAAVCIIYLIFGICGYVLYGSKCPSDVLIAFVGGADVVVARLAMTFSVCGTYPLAFVACQATLQDKFFNSERNKVWNYENKPWLRKVIILVTQIVYLILSCIIPTIGPVVSVNGAVSTIGLISLFPIAAVWKVGFGTTEYTEITRQTYQSTDVESGDRKSSYQQAGYGQRSLTTKLGLSFMLLIGVVFGVMGFVVEFQEVG